jgi:hypothetical protein
MKTFNGTIDKCHAPNIHNGGHMFRMVKDLKDVLRKGKEVGSKKIKKAVKNAEKNGNKTSRLLKKDQYFGTYHIGRT